MCFSRKLYSSYIRIAVTRDYVMTVLCPYVIVCVSVLVDRDVRRMHDDENPIPALLDDENADRE